MASCTFATEFCLGGCAVKFRYHCLRNAVGDAAEFKLGKFGLELIRGIAVTIMCMKQK